MMTFLGLLNAWSYIYQSKQIRESIKNEKSVIYPLYKGLLALFDYQNILIWQFSKSPLYKGFLALPFCYVFSVEKNKVVLFVAYVYLE